MEGGHPSRGVAPLACCLPQPSLPLLAGPLQVSWLEESMPYYPPTVNDGEAYKFAMDVAGRWAGQASLAEVCDSTGACLPQC